MADNDNSDIPTLGEIIFPGNPDKVVRTELEPKADQTPAPPEPPEASPTPKTTDAESESGNRGRPSSFESLISTRIDHILEKHMEAAREEIVRMVMLELRARLPGTSRSNDSD